METDRLEADGRVQGRHAIPGRAWGARPTSLSDRTIFAIAVNNGPANGIPSDLVELGISGPGLLGLQPPAPPNASRSTYRLPDTDHQGGNWRVDSWMLLRQGGGLSNANTAGRPASYGANQIGAVVRYRPGSHQPAFLYARASRALIEKGETELAVGVGARPIATVPVVAQAEMRLTETSGATILRPAAFVTSELAPLAITDRFEAEAYAQAGYVGGEFATGFVDGQARIERRMFRLADAEVRLGAGVWGGAQSGAARLDIGPSASVRKTFGTVPLRLQVDYRVRLAGAAEPGSGVAITLSSGF